MATLLYQDTQLQGLFPVMTYTRARVYKRLGSIGYNSPVSHWQYCTAPLSYQPRLHLFFETYESLKF